MTTFILDNSVTMRWCFDAGMHPCADGVLHQLEAIDGLTFASVLWRYEVSSMLARAQKGGTLSARRVTNFLTNLRALDIVVHIQGVDHILTDVHQLATTYRLTSYDAAYLELALRRDLPLATLDEELMRACKAARVSVL